MNEYACLLAVSGVCEENIIWSIVTKPEIKLQVGTERGLPSSQICVFNALKSDLFLIVWLRD